MSREKVGAEEFTKRLASLCSSGIGPGFPRRVRDTQILLRSMAMGFVPGTHYTEREVGNVLRTWLEAAGPRVDLDHVSMRRALVDGHYLDRDRGGSTYRLSPSDPENPFFAPGLDGLDPLLVMREARENAERRKQAVRRGDFLS